MQRVLSLSIAILAVSLCFGCKKKGPVTTPVLSTKPVINITLYSATSGGIIKSDGGESIYAYGVCWNTTGNPKVTDSNTSETLGASMFVSDIGDLNPNTIYYLRAYAYNSSGTGYGEELTFKTDVDTTDLGTRVVDIDGNVYNTVAIEGQVWMKENLRTTKYNNGKAIPEIIDATNWYNCTNGAYCDWGNIESNSNTYGRLYNWFVTLKSVCPTGWHVPSRSEWETLKNTAGGENAAGGRLKEIGTSHWNDPNREATDQYGFTALPGGYRVSYENRFDPLGLSANFWTSTEFSDAGAWFYGIYNYAGTLGSNSNLKTEGLSIRCIKD